MRKRADQTRGCQPHNEKETGADHGPMPGGQPLQNHAGRDGTTLQYHGAIAGSSGMVRRKIAGGPVWKQSPHPGKLWGVRQAQTDTASVKGKGQKELVTEQNYLYGEKYPVLIQAQTRFALA